MSYNYENKKHYNEKLNSDRDFNKRCKLIYSI